MQMTTPIPTVEVLMCTYNGGRFLAQQLDSLVAQQGVRVRLHVSDDGSTDDTLEVLARYRESLQLAEVRQGPGKGATTNFLSLVTDAALPGKYFAFCDQDDIWEPEKLSRACEALAPHAGRAALYCGHSKVIDEQGALVGHSKPHRKPPSFANASVQNIASGHTMVFNAGARELLMQAGVVDVRFHDWWLYVVLTFAGGTVVHDGEALVRYRQHANNEFGAHSSIANQFGRFKLLFNGEYGRWLRLHQRALEALAPISREPEKVALLARIFEGNVFARFDAMKRGGFHRQTRVEQLALWATVILGRV